MKPGAAFFFVPSSLSHLFLENSLLEGSEVGGVVSESSVRLLDGERDVVTGNKHHLEELGNQREM